MYMCIELFKEVSSLVLDTFSELTSRSHQEKDRIRNVDMADRNKCAQKRTQPSGGKWHLLL